MNLTLIDADDFLNKIELLIQKYIHPIESKEPEPLINSEEAIKLLNCSIGTLHNWIKSGRIPYSKIGRKLYFKKNDLLNLASYRNKGV